MGDGNLYLNDPRGQPSQEGGLRYVYATRHLPSKIHPPDLKRLPSRMLSVSLLILFL